MALSEAGAAKLREIEQQRTATLQGYLQDWSEIDAEETAKTLKKLAESLRDSARAKTAGSTEIIPLV
ncbi:hypothetical protein D9M72_431320 [compost metagenome]